MVLSRALPWHLSQPTEPRRHLRAFFHSQQGPLLSGQTTASYYKYTYNHASSCPITRTRIRPGRALVGVSRSFHVARWPTVRIICRRLVESHLFRAVVIWNRLWLAPTTQVGYLTTIRSNIQRQTRAAYIWALPAPSTLQQDSSQHASTNLARYRT